MHEAILVNANVHERAEVRHVRDHAFHPAARNEVVDGLDAVIEFRVAEFLTRVAARLLQFLHDIVEGSLTHLVGEELIDLDSLHRFGIAHDILHRNTHLLGHLFHEGVVFGVHRGIIQRIFGTRNAHKARRLLEGLRTEALHLLQVFTAGKRAVLFAVLHDGFRKRIAEARHMGKERSGSAVHVHTHHVHAAFHHFVEALFEFALVHVVLVLAHADRLRVHLHEFGKRVLQAAANRNRAAGRHVFLREFLDGNHACTVNGSAGLAHDNARRNLALELEGHLATEGVGLAARGSVTDGDEINLVLVDELHQVHSGTGLVVPRFMRLDNAMIHELAVFVEHSHLAARTETWVESEHGLVTGRGGKQNVLQVLAEHLEGFLFGGVLEHQAHFAFHARLQQAFPGVLAHGLQVRSPGRFALDNLGLEVADHFVVRHFDGEAQHLLLFATAERKHAVARNLADRLAEVVIVLELCFLLLEILLDLGNHHAGLFHLGTEVLAEFGIVGNLFGENVGGTLEGGLRVGKALLLGEVDAGDFFGGIAGIFLSPHQASQRFKTEFLRDGRAGALLGLVRGVNIFEESLVLAGLDLGLEFGSELALFLDALEHRFLTVGKFLQIVATVADVAQFNFVQRTRLVLAVAGDKGDRAPLVHEFKRLSDAPYFELQFFGNNCGKIHVLFLYVDF